MGRHEIILDSVRKLLALAVSDEEILLNLEDIGLSKVECQQVLNESKGLAAGKKKIEVEDSGQILRDVAESLQKTVGQKTDEEKEKEVMASEIVGDKEQNVKIFEKKPVVEKQKPQISVVKLPKPVEEQTRPERHANIDKLWEKGILITVNQRFAEMQKMKKEIDSVIEQKVSQASEKELQKFKILFDSQKTLLLDRMDSSLEEKAHEITLIIDAKIAEMKKINDDIKKNISALDGEKQTFEAAIADVESKIGELQSVKQKAVSELNSEMIKYKSKMQEFLDSAELKIQEIDERVSRTLELESKIAEGLVDDAKDKIDQISLEKVGEIKAELEPQISEIRELSSKVNIERIDSKLAEIDEYRENLIDKVGDAAKKNVELKVQNLEKRLNAKIVEFDRKTTEILEKGVLARISEIDRRTSDVLDKKVSTKISEMDNALADFSKKADVEGAKNLMNDLNAFKEQFIRVIESNVKKYNDSIKDINVKSKALDEQISIRIKTIDGKISELEDFEKKFSEEVSSLVDKISEKQKK